MEEWQKTVIIRNLPLLMQNTIVNRFLLTILQAKSVLSSPEADSIIFHGRNKGMLDQSKMLYEILMTKTTGYEAIQEALLKTNQSVAYKILYDGKRNFEKSSREDLHIALSDSISWQKEYLREQLPNLIETTLPNITLLSFLISKSVFNKADKEYIDSVGGEMEKTRLLYEIIQTRIGGYEAMQDALINCRQALAYKILQDGLRQYKQLNSVCDYHNFTVGIWDKEFVDSHLQELIKWTKVDTELLGHLLASTFLNNAEVEQIECTEEPTRADKLYEILIAKKVGYRELEEALYQSRQFDASKIFLDWEKEHNALIYQPVLTFEQEASKEEEEVVSETPGASVQSPRRFSKRKGNSKLNSSTKDQETQTSDGEESSLHQTIHQQDTQHTNAEEGDLDALMNANQTKTQQSSDISVPKFKHGPKDFQEMLTSKKISYILIGTADVPLTLSKIQDTVTEMDIKIKEIGYWRQLKIFLADCKNRACLSGNEMMPLLVLHHKTNTPIKASTTKGMIRIFGKLKAPINTKIVIVLKEDPHILENYRMRYFLNPEHVVVLRDSFSWSDLTYQFQKILLKREILDQANHRYLEDFCNTFVYENKELLLQSFVKDQLLIDLIHFKQFPVIFRQTIPPVSHYVGRRLISRYVISTSVFRADTESEVFVFTGFNSIDDLEEIARGCVGKIDSSGNQINEITISAKYILLEREYDLKKIRDEIANRQNIHWLHYDHSCLIWKQTFGKSIETLLKFVCSRSNQRRITEMDFLEMVETRSPKEPVIISDSPGMGKSFLLTNLAEKTRERYSGNSLVFYFLMTDFITSVLKQQSRKGVSTDYILDECIEEEIIHYSSNYNLSPNMLTVNSSSTLYIFFDGLDELPADQVSPALKCLQRIKFLFPLSRLHITTRLNLMHRLESSLCTLGYTIEPFDHPSQVGFLAEHWSRVRLTEPRLIYEKLEEFGENCLSTLKRVVTKDEKDFAGIPLQCFLLAEVFEKEAVEFGEPENSVLVKKAQPRIQVKSITQLYELLVQRKFQIFNTKNMNTYGRPICETALQKIHTYVSVQVVMTGTDWHSKLRATFLDPETFGALKRMIPNWNVTLSQFQNGQLPREDILAVGLLEEIEVGCWKFVHRTFAEYLIARFGSDVINHGQLNPRKSLTPHIREFVQEAVLSTLDSYIEISESISLNSFKFKYPVVCHFLNTWSNPHGAS